MSERPQDRYNKSKTTTVLLRLNKSTDADIIERLDTTENKTGYIKTLIRADIERRPKKMIKRIISDCFTLDGERLYNGEQLLQAVREYGGEFDRWIELDNGVTLRECNDGRYFNDADEFDKYAAVYDWDEDADQGDLIGFVQL